MLNSARPHISLDLDASALHGKHKMKGTRLHLLQRRRIQPLKAGLDVKSSLGRGGRGEYDSLYFVLQERPPLTSRHAHHSTASIRAGVWWTGISPHPITDGMGRSLTKQPMLWSAALVVGTNLRSGPQLSRGTFPTPIHCTPCGIERHLVYAQEIMYGVYCNYQARGATIV